MEYPFKTAPMDHQVQGLRMLGRLGGGGLLWDPGTGKTKTVIDYMGALTLRRKRLHAFVAAPLSAVDTWPDEVDLHLPDVVERRVIVLSGSGADKVQAVRDLDKDFDGLTLVVVNLDVFSQSHTMPGTKTVTVRNAMVKAVRDHGFDLGVVDESHRIKGATSNVSRAFAGLADAFPRKIIMTGTVAPHSPIDVYAQWRFLNPERFGTRLASFESRYAIKGGYRGKQIIGFRNQTELRDERAKDSMVVRKEDALDLPPVTDVVHTVRLSKRERKAYNDMAKNMVISKDGHLAPNAVVQWLRLRQLTSGHITDPITGKPQHYGDSKIRMCADLVSSLVEQGEKVVVFAHFRDDVFRASIAITNAVSRKVGVCEITGDTPGEQRQQIRKWFLNEKGPAVIVAQMRTVSLAINEFVVANHAVFLSMSERRDDYIQARDRLNRKGQTKPVTFHHLHVKGSIDQDLMLAHRQKGSLESFLLANVRPHTLDD